MKDCCCSADIEKFYGRIAGEFVIRRNIQSFLQFSMPMDAQNGTWVTVACDAAANADTTQHENRTSDHPATIACPDAATYAFHLTPVQSVFMCGLHSPLELRPVLRQCNYHSIFESVTVISGDPHRKVI